MDSARVEKNNAVAWLYRWKLDGEWTNWRVSDASQKSSHLKDLEEHALYSWTITSLLQWQPIKSAPRDGTRFLAVTTTVADEYDDYDRQIAKNVSTQDIVVAYFLFGGFVSYPFTGSIPINVKFTHWQPLPRPPVTP